MAKYYYNGVLLPEIPANVLAAYPYRIIFLNIESKYRLIAAEQPWYWNVRTSPSLFIDAICNNVSYSLSDDNTEWTFSAKYTDQGSWSPEEIVWASFDIPYADPDGTEIHFEGSDPVPEEPEKPEYAERYSILGSILVGTARQIMRLTDSTKKVKPEEFEPKLEGINIQLQELTVTATEEVQTITPPSGVYGFSKVIVEAVESSGTGGGGTPGEGGDDPEPEETYASAENTIFGTAQEPSKIYTGKYFYGKYPTAINLPGGAISGDYKYAVLAYKTDGKCLYLMVSTKPLSTKSDYTYAQSGSTGKVYSYDSDTDTWGASVAMSGATSLRHGSIVWTNFDLCIYNEYTGRPTTTLYMAKSSPVPETIDGGTVEYVPTDETYTVSGETMNYLGAVTQQITGISAATPADMIAALQMYAGTATAETTD